MATQHTGFVLAVNDGGMVMFQRTLDGKKFYFRVDPTSALAVALCDSEGSVTITVSGIDVVEISAPTLTEAEKVKLDRDNRIESLLSTIAEVLPGHRLLRVEGRVRITVPVGSYEDAATVILLLEDILRYHGARGNITCSHAKLGLGVVALASLKLCV